MKQEKSNTHRHTIHMHLGSVHGTQEADSMKYMASRFLSMEMRKHGLTEQGGTTRSGKRTIALRDMYASLNMWNEMNMANRCISTTQMPMVKKIPRKMHIHPVWMVW